MVDHGGRILLLTFTAIGVLSLAGLLYELTARGLPHVEWGFFRDPPSYRPERAGIFPALFGTLWIGVVSMAIALPLGIAAAIYLNEFSQGGRINTLLRSSIANLAGVPSVVFGILGLALFVRAMALGKSILAASLTLALLTLPIVIVVAEEALRSVPRTVREAAFALGASRWQVVRHHVLPYSMPGMLTGSILALSRSMGETAPLILIGASVYITFAPAGVTDAFTALPIQSYYWAQDADPSFHDLAWATVFVLVVLTFLGNLVAVLLRDRYQRRFRW